MPERKEEVMWGRKGMERLVSKRAAKLAKNISKEDFLKQLKEQWRPYVKKHAPIEEELAAATGRINSSGEFKKAFEAVGITETDIQQVLEEIREEKVDPYKRPEAKVGRNDPCPCGSGKKYKKCCGK